jgi:hypothetical protein
MTLHRERDTHISDQMEFDVLEKRGMMDSPVDDVLRGKEDSSPVTSKVQPSNSRYSPQDTSVSNLCNKLKKLEEDIFTASGRHKNIITRVRVGVEGILDSNEFSVTNLYRALLTEIRDNRVE